MCVHSTDSRGVRRTRLDYCTPTYTNSRHQCFRWSYVESTDADLQTQLFKLDTTLPRCPCDITKLDRQFEQVTIADRQCYATSFPASNVDGSRVSSFSLMSYIFLIFFLQRSDCLMDVPFPN